MEMHIPIYTVTHCVIPGDATGQVFKNAQFRPSHLNKKKIDTFLERQPEVHDYLNSLVVTFSPDTRQKGTYVARRLFAQRLI